VFVHIEEAAQPPGGLFVRFGSSRRISIVACRHNARIDGMAIRRRVEAKIP
jgi:hypothetical protein